jgi:hypothetical protein
VVPCLYKYAAHRPRGIMVIHPIPKPYMVIRAEDP